jgi:YcxB-like protein
MITLRYQLKPEDCKRAYRFTLGRDNWLSCLFLIIFFIVYLGSSYIFFGLAYFYDRLYTVMLWTFFSYFFVFLFPIVTPFRGLQAEYVAVISPETIEITSEYRSMRLRLSAFSKYRVSKDQILLYDSWGLFHIFPRRSFPSEEDYQTFLSYLEANLGNPESYN